MNAVTLHDSKCGTINYESVCTLFEILFLFMDLYVTAHGHMK
jgi:hypothetical protein